MTNVNNVTDVIEDAIAPKGRLRTAFKLIAVALVGAAALAVVAKTRSN